MGDLFCLFGLFAYPSIVFFIVFDVIVICFLIVYFLYLHFEYYPLTWFSGLPETTYPILPSPCFYDCVLL